MRKLCDEPVTLVQLAVMLGFLLAMQGCRSKTSFPMEKVSGKIAYDDGSLIPAKSIKIRFEPLVSPLDPKTHPRPGQTAVDTATGEFSEVTTYSYGDGLIRGRHKVLLIVESAPSGDKPTELIPPEYKSFEETPLEIDVEDSPFYFQIPRP